MVPWIIRLALLAAPLSAVVAAADEPPGPAEGSPRAAETAAPLQTGPNSLKSLWPGLPFDIWYLWGEDGRPVVILDKIAFREFLEFKASKRRKQVDPFAVTSIACTGAVVDDRLPLTVVLKVIVTAPDEWVRVPLNMLEATMLDSVHTGPGEAYPTAYDQETGHTWYIKGQGTHELTLKLAVPVRKPGVGRRVQLSLPPTAQSSLKLTIPYSRVTAKTAEKSDVEVKSEGAASEISVFGLGSRLDLAWQQSPELNSAETRLEAVTSVTATLAALEQIATLEATQTIRTEGQQGSFDEVRVALPPAGELQFVSCPEYKDHKADPDNPHQVIVKLSRSTTGPINLRWTVRMPLPAAGEPFILEGFDVARARIQTGMLAVAVVGDFRLTPIPDEDKFVQRINLADLPPALRQSRTVAAYRFLTRLRLKLALQRDKPFVSATTAMWVHVEPGGMELEAAYQLEVRGSISELSFRWPGWKDAGWIVESLGSVGIPDSTNADRLRIEFDEPARDKVEFRIRARRPLPEGATSFPLSLPVADTSAGFPILLTVVRPENLEVTLAPEAGTVLHAEPKTAKRIAVPRELSKLPHDDYRVESPDARFAASVTVHPREVSTSTTVEAAVRSGTITVRQQIHYNVTYDNLSHVQLAIPSGLNTAQLRLSLVDGAELPLRASMRQSDGVWRIPLDRPRTGHFELELKYAFESPRPTELTDDQSVVVPLAESKDAEFLATRFQWHDADGRDAVVQGEGWTRLPDPDGIWIWTHARGTSEIETHLTRGRGGLRGAAVTRALLRSAISADGTIHTRADYQLSGAVRGLTISFPAGVEPIGIRWNHTLVRLPQPQVDELGATSYSLVLERSPLANPLLSVETAQRGDLLSRFASEMNLAAPQFPDSLPILDCLWRVSLPAGQHLFVEPRGFAAEFHWQRSQLFWSRQSNRNEAELAAWVDPDASRDADALSGPAFSGQGDDYLFSRAGAPGTMSLSVMSRPGIVLIGAGAALGLGLLLVYWPAARHVLTLLIVSFCVALLAVWFPGPVLVLLQPAGLGILLAIAAAAIQTFLRRKTAPISVTLTSPSGFMTPTSSVSPGVVVSVGSNEYTSVRGPTPGTAIESPQPVGQLSQSTSPP